MAQRNTQKKNSPIYAILIMLLIGIICFALFKIGTILLEQQRNQDTYEQISELADEGIDWDELRKINPDIVAWIKIEGTNIDYPIVTAPDNDKYLHTKFDGKQGSCGTLFVDANTTKPFKNFLTIVYGHHMKDGTMFNNLKKFKGKSFFDDHTHYDLYTPTQNYTVEIVGFYNPKSTSKFYDTEIETERQKFQYIDMLERDAKNESGERATTNDRLVLLSTCAYEYKNARYILVGRLVKK